MAGRPWTEEQHKKAFERSRENWQQERIQLEKELAEHKVFCDELSRQINGREGLTQTLPQLHDYLQKMYFEMVSDPRRSSRRTQLLGYDIAMTNRLADRDESTKNVLESMQRSYCVGLR